MKIHGSKLYFAVDSIPDYQEVVGVADNRTEALALLGEKHYAPEVLELDLNGLLELLRERNLLWICMKG